MAIDNRSDLIRQLNANFNSDSKKQKDEDRFDEDTLTLMSDKDVARLKEIKAAQQKGKRHELSLERKEYDEIILGKRSFLILKDVGYSRDDSILIREFENFKPTGNMDVKIITYVDKETTGLKDGYCVVSWV